MNKFSRRAFVHQVALKHLLHNFMSCFGLQVFKDEGEDEKYLKLKFQILENLEQITKEVSISPSRGFNLLLHAA